MHAPDIIRQNERSGEGCEAEFSLLVGDVISLTEIASTEHLLYEKSQST